MSYPEPTDPDAFFWDGAQPCPWIAVQRMVRQCVDAVRDQVRRGEFPAWAYAHTGDTVVSALCYQDEPRIEVSVMTPRITMYTERADRVA